MQRLNQIVILGLLVAACGGGSEFPSPTLGDEPESTRNDFEVRRADVVRSTCQAQASFGDERFAVSCVSGACTCTQGDVRLGTCEHVEEGCALVRNGDEVTGACCHFSLATESSPGETERAQPASRAQCQAQMSVAGRSHQVTCEDGACTCSTDGAVVGSCEEPDNRCEIRQVMGVRAVGCCRF